MCDMTESISKEGVVSDARTSVFRVRKRGEVQAVVHGMETVVFARMEIDAKTI